MDLNLQWTGDMQQVRSLATLCRALSLIITLCHPQPIGIVNRDSPHWSGNNSTYNDVALLLTSMKVCRQLVPPKPVGNLTLYDVAMVWC